MTVFRLDIVSRLGTGMYLPLLCVLFLIDVDVHVKASHDFENVFARKCARCVFMLRSPVKEFIKKNQHVVN